MLCHVFCTSRVSGYFDILKFSEVLAWKDCTRNSLIAKMSLSVIDCCL